NRRRRRFGRKCRRRASRCKQESDLEADEISRQRGQLVITTFRPSERNDQIPSLGKCGFAQAAAERCNHARRLAGRAATEESNDRHRSLLRAYRERPRSRRAADERDELAPPHSITSSAVTSRVCGPATPSIRAVEALITNSSLVDGTTGKSAGFAPLRMRPA